MFLQIERLSAPAEVASVTEAPRRRAASAPLHDGASMTAGESAAPIVAMMRR
jgi:hypothetical protein